MLCRKCGILVKPYLSGAQYHPLCEPLPSQAPAPPKSEPVFQRSIDPGGRSHIEVDVQETLTEIINWAAQNMGRSGQILVGPSELGTPCDRELAYRIAGMEAAQQSDPLPAIIGTASHVWMEQAVQAFEREHGLKRFRTEMKVSPDVALTGTTDVYWEEKALVLDWKFPGPDPIREMRKHGMSNRYRVQLNLYGLGHKRAGRPVERVGLVALSRSGYLKDMLVIVEDYQEQVALDAIQRMYDLGNQVDKEGILDEPGRWSMISATPSRLCGWCRMYRPGGDADDTGCPGR